MVSLISHLEGLLPVQDSKIYTLVFRLLSEIESFLLKNEKVISLKHMTKEELVDVLVIGRIRQLQLQNANEDLSQVQYETKAAPKRADSPQEIVKSLYTKRHQLDLETISQVQPAEKSKSDQFKSFQTSDQRPLVQYSTNTHLKDFSRDLPLQKSHQSAFALLPLRYQNNSEMTRNDSGLDEPQIVTTKSQPHFGQQIKTECTFAGGLKLNSSSSNNNVRVELGSKRLIAPSSESMYVDTLDQNQLQEHLHEVSRNTHTVSYINTDGQTPRLHENQENRAKNFQNESPKLDIFTSGYFYQETLYRETLSPTSALAENFKIQVKAMRAWQNYTRLNKKRRAFQKQLYDGLVKAIAFHQSKLAIRVFKAFAQYRSRLSIWSVVSDFVRDRVKHNTKRFYLKLMLQQFQERKVKVCLNSFATEHFARGRIFSVFKTWKAYSRQKKKQEMKVMYFFQKRASCVDLLTKFLATHYFSQLPKAAPICKNFDLIDFYSYTMTHCKLTKRGKKRFTKVVETSIKSRLRQVFIGGWLKFHRKVKAFRKAFQLTELVKPAFAELKQNWTLQKTFIQVLAVKKSDIQLRVLNALSKFVFKRTQQNEILAKFAKKHEQLKRQQMFSQWLNLYKFYTDKPCVQSSALKSVLFSKLRVFRRLKGFSIARKGLRSRINRKFFQRRDDLLRRVFYNVKVFSLKRVFLRESLASKLQGNKAALKKRYLKAFKRAFNNRVKIAAYRAWKLQQKGLQGLTKRVEYRKLQQQVKLICHHQYNTGLFKRSVRTWRNVLRRDKQNSVSIVKFKQQSKNRQLQQLFLYWTRFTLEAKLSSQAKILATSHFKGRLLQKMFFLLRERIRNLQRTALNFKVARTFHSSHLLEQYFDRLVSAVRSKLHLKKSLHSIKYRQESTFLKKTFKNWHRQFSSLVCKEKMIVIKIKRKALLKTFLGWKAFWAQKNKLKFQSALLVENINGDCLKKVFAAWQTYSRAENKYRQMKAFSRFFFLQKILVSTLNTMRQNVRLSKVERLLTQRQRHLVAVKCFEALKTHNINEKKTRWFQVMVLLPAKCTKIFSEWSAFAFKRKRNREIQTFFETRRELSIKEGIFQAIKNCRVSDQQYKQIFYKRRLLLAWQKVAHRQADLHQKSSVVEHNRFLVSKFKALQAWRQELFLNFAEKRVAIPFFEALKIKQAWTALKEHSHLEKQLARFNSRRLKRKTLSAFTLFAQHQHNLRVFRAIAAFKQQKRVLLSFAAVIRKRKVLHSITGLLQSRTIVKHLKRRVFNHWIEMFHDNVTLKPLEQAIKVEVRQKNLIKTAFAGLKAYYRIKEGKKQMRQSVDNYYQEMLLERSFRQMQVFTEICQEKRELSKSAAYFAKHSLKKRGFQCLLEAFYLEQKNEMHLDYTARKYLVSATLKKVWGCLRANVFLEFDETLAGEKGQLAGQFSDRVLKMKALKLLMLNVLTRKYRTRVQKVFVRGSRDKVQQILKSLASKKAQSRLKNKASRNSSSTTKTKAIRKTRSKAVARLSSAHSEYKAQMKI